MFEFRMSYKEPGYHKPGDPPFSFPPRGIDPKIDANLIAIEGKNGTGKTTLLNCLALAMGYLDREKELETKTALKRKLQELDENSSLEYSFRICCEKPESVELRIERAKGQKSRFWLNSSQIDTEALSRKVEVIYLTEDDPRKVINASLKNLARHFNELEKGLESTQTAVYKHIQDIDEFQQFKKKEEDVVNDVSTCKKKIEEKERQVKRLQEKLKEIESRDRIYETMELLKNEDRITIYYDKAKGKYEQLEGKTGTDFMRQLERKRFELRTADEILKDINGRIEQVCMSLRTYGISISCKKLLENDYTELNELQRKIKPQKAKQIVEMQIIDEMLELFRRHRDDCVVPIINKPVHDVNRELMALKLKSLADRAFALLEALDKVMNERKSQLVAIEKIHEKISLLSQRSKDVENISEITVEFQEAEKKYMDLQVARKQNKIGLVTEWKKVESTVGDAVAIRGEIGEMEVSIRTEKNMQNKCEENLRLLRENATRKPKYQGKEKKLRALHGAILSMREYVNRWILILNDPAERRKDFASVKGKGVFGLSDYEKFLATIGEYLGNQFEPIPFDNKLYDVRFFDIEKEIFTTKDNKQIQLHWLSQGQNKIVTLNASLKKLDPTKKGVILIDEIADLDPEKLQTVKNTLKEKFIEGSVLLALLVRPPRESSSKMIEITGWS